MKQEIWKIVIINKKEYPYEVSSFGNVRNCKCHILTPFKRGQRKGTYFSVDLYICGRKKRIDVQRLVALMFIDNPEEKPEVNHYDLNHFNNRADNLEWVTRSENMCHAYFMRECQKMEGTYEACVL